MAEYVILAKFTAKGTQHLPDVGTWVPQWQTAWESLGGTGTWHDPLFTMGPYDCIITGEMDSEDKVAAFVIWLSHQGYVSTTTMKAYSPADFVQLLPEEERGYKH